MIGTIREFTGRQDCLEMLRLVENNPATTTHVLDMPYRLSSPSLDDPRSVGLWQSEAGELNAFAVIQWPWQTLDYAFASNLAEIGIEQQILDWVIERFPVLSKQYLPYEHPLLFIDVPQEDVAKINLLNRNNFSRHSWQTTHFVKSLQGELSQPALPPGFSIRNVADAVEYVEIHRAAFSSDTMTIKWRLEVEKWSNYRPELNIVAVAPDGKVAAFCCGWTGRVDSAKLAGVDPVELVGQIEPMGVHPDYRQLKLGRAVLEEVFRRMQISGVKQVIVETDNFRDSAQGLYRAVGFEEKYLVYKFSREF